MAEEKWLKALRDLYGREGSLRKTGEVLGVSSTTVKRVLDGSYGADTANIRGIVEGKLLGATVECPVLGEISRDVCLKHQRRKFAGTNHIRVQLWKTCPGCEHNRKGEA